MQLPDDPPFQGKPDPGAQQFRDVEKALAISSGLSNWDMRFLDDVYLQLQSGRNLTERQERQVDRILEEHGL
ncbi:MAG: hypothetical protein GY716_15940 [bacterium]|nr:hypothetical protein [bacterium]